MGIGALLHKIVLLEMCQVEVKDNKIFYLGFIEDKTFVLQHFDCSIILKSSGSFGLYYWGTSLFFLLAFVYLLMMIGYPWDDLFASSYAKSLVREPQFVIDLTT